MRHKKLPLVWGGILILFGALVLITPILPIRDPGQTSPDLQFAPPGTVHWMGTDHLGRDVFSRTMWGARYSLSGAFLATLVAMVLGVGIGGVAGLFGRWLDDLLMRGVDVLLAFPGLLLAIIIITILGAGLWQVALAVGIALMPVYSRLVRSAILTVREQLYVEAAVSLGAGPVYILIHHLIPNVSGQILSFATVVYAWSMLDIAVLDFLGLTGSPSIPTWGRILNDGRAYLRVAPWIAICPGAFLTLIILALTGLSDQTRSGIFGR